MGLLLLVAMKTAGSCFLRYTFPSLKLAVCQVCGPGLSNLNLCHTRVPLLVLAFGTIHICTGRLHNLTPGSRPENMSFGRYSGTKYGLLHLSHIREPLDSRYLYGLPGGKSTCPKGTEGSCRWGQDHDLAVWTRGEKTRLQLVHIWKSLAANRSHNWLENTDAVSLGRRTIFRCLQQSVYILGWSSYTFSYAWYLLILKTGL
jgi:hypothetical protein